MRLRVMVLFIGFIAVMFDMGIPCIPRAELLKQPLQARGVVRAIKRATLSSEISGRIIRMPFRAGDSFSRGQVLISFDCRLLKAEQERASANLEGAEKKLENDRELEGLKSIGQLDVSLDEVEVRRHKAELEIATLSVSRCTIVAPYSGRVVEQKANLYESVHPQQELLEIVSTDDLELEIMVSSSWLSWLRKGTLFNARIDETGAMVAGSVKALGAVVDPVSKMTRIRASLDHMSEGLLPGMSATLNFKTGNKNK